MAVRYCKIALSGASAFFLLLVVFNNLADYGSNYRFVENVLKMATTFEGNRGLWRAIEAPALHHLFYGVIILWEFFAMALISAGTLRMWQSRRRGSLAWQNAKSITIVGHTAALLLWYVAFLAIGGEWFLMWQSRRWNGQDAAGRMFIVMAACLVIILLRDPEPDEEPARS